MIEWLFALLFLLATLAADLHDRTEQPGAPPDDGWTVLVEHDGALD